MQKAEQVPPVLTLFRLGAGNYTLRIADLKDNHIAVALAKLIPDLASLQLITPNDVKLFRFDEEPKPRPKMAVEIPPSSEPESQEQHDLEEVVEDGTSVSRKVEPLTPNAPCGRCGATGEVDMLFEGGQAGKAPCPVCKGTGEIIHYRRGR